MSKTKETDLDVGRTLTKVRRHKGSGKIEPRPRGKRSESYDYGYSDGSAFIPESDVDGGAKKKKTKADPEPKKKSRTNDPAPTPAEVAAVMKAEKRKLEKKAGKKVSPKQAAIAKLTKQVKAADKKSEAQTQKLDLQAQKQQAKLDMQAQKEQAKQAAQRKSNDASTPLPVPAKKRGRPKGSKNNTPSIVHSATKLVTVGSGNFSDLIEKAVNDAAVAMATEKTNKALALIDSVLVGLGDLRKFLEA